MRPYSRFAVSLCLAACALLGAPRGALAQVFPEDAEFVAGQCLGSVSTDPARDESGAQGGRDLVGEAPTDAVIYTADTEEFVFFRMRVDADPSGPGGFDQFGWVFLIDTDGDVTDFEFHVALDGVGEEVILSQNTTTDLPNDPTEEPDPVPLATYDSATHARATATTSVIDGETDYFITFAVAKSDLESASVPTGLFSVWAGTSSNSKGLNGDIACFDNALGTPTLQGTATDPVILGTFVTVTTPSEGAVITDSTPTVSGTTEPGNTVVVSVDGGDPIAATVDASGNWSVTLPELASGPHTIEVTATDPVEEDTADATVTFTVDTTDTDECAAGTDTCDPNATCTNASPGFTCACNPGFTGDGTVCFQVIITDPISESVVTDTTPGISGTAAPGATVIISVDGVNACTTTANPNGNFFCEITTPLAEGPHVVTATTPVGEATDMIVIVIDTMDVQIDSDADGVPDSIEQPGGIDRDTDGDGIPDHLDPDDDGDGIPTVDERADTGDSGVGSDADGDGLPNWRDPDADGDGVNDGTEGRGDADDDGIPDYLDPDTTGIGGVGGVAGGARCSVSAPGASAPGAGAAFLVLALGVLLGVRRRCGVRRRRGVAALSVVALATLGVASTASAQVQLDQYRATENTEDGFAVRSTDVMEHGTIEGQIVLDYANDPLVFESDLGNEDSEIARIVEHQLTGTALLSFGLFDRVLFFAGLPVALVMEGDDVGSLPVAAADGAGLGDLFLGGRLRLLGDGGEGFGLGLQATLTTPTADAAEDDQAYLGDGTVTFAPVLLADYRAGRLRLAANLGARVRRNEELPGGTTFGDELTYGLGVTYGVVEDLLAVHVDLYGNTSFQDFFDREATFFELLGGVRFQHPSGFRAGLAAGPGLVRGYGSPDVRAIATIGFRADLIEEEAPPAAAPAEEAPSDLDGDGILDDDDACPQEPEDIDQFEDDDGCPDPDNDDDGVLDVNDGAPMDPEDPDGYQDEDGVPDPDNDADGIPDASDQCPLEAGTARNDGCPDRDRDGDTVIDRLDNCPDQAGPVENQGCPEQQQVRIEEGRLQILDNIYFATNSDRILRRSFTLLDNVARVLVEHPEIDVIRIEGHTDSRGSREHNVTLSQRRAESVVGYLVGKGVAAERLQARGFGPDRPVVPNARTAAEHAQNRRVEFNLGGEVEGVRQGTSGAPTETTDR